MSTGVAQHKIVTLIHTTLEDGGAEVLKSVRNEGELVVRCLVEQALMLSDDMFRRMAEHSREREAEHSRAREAPTAQTLAGIEEETQARADEDHATAQSALMEMLESATDQDAAEILAGASAEIEPEEPPMAVLPGSLLPRQAGRHPRPRPHRHHSPAPRRPHANPKPITLTPARSSSPLPALGIAGRSGSSRPRRGATTSGRRLWRGCAACRCFAKWRPR